MQSLKGAIGRKLAWLRETAQGLIGLAEAER